jgi:hypothetical protein
VPMDQNVDWQQGGSRLINTTGHSTSQITSMQLNGTGRPVLVHRVSVRDQEAGASTRRPPLVSACVAPACFVVLRTAGESGVDRTSGDQTPFVPRVCQDGQTQPDNP